LERTASHFGRIDDTGLHEILVSIGSHIVTNVSFFVLHFLDDESTFATGVRRKLAKRGFDSTP
jgi:hypothetical protein